MTRATTNNLPAFNYIVLVIGVFACSLSVIFLKSSQSHPFWLCAARLLIAAVFLTPLALNEVRKNLGVASWRSVMASAPGAIMLSVHFITWTMGARLTDAANGSLIVNLTTVVMPIVMWLMNSERINRGEIIGTLIALSGVLMLVGSHYKLSAQGFQGDLVCFGSMVLFCFYLAFGRKHGMNRNIWVYVVPLYWISGLLCALAAILVPGIPLPPLTWHEIAMLVCLGLIPTVIGHSIMNWCIKTMRGQVVSTANLAQFMFAGVTGYFFLNPPNVPSIWFYPVSLLIVIGSIIVIRSHKQTVDVDAES